VGAEEQRCRGARERVESHEDLDVYRLAYRAAMQVFSASKVFPPEERYSLTDQVRRSSRSVCSNIAEAWRKRRYEAAFVSKLNDAEAEAAETQTWIQFAVDCGCLSEEIGKDLRAQYDQIIGKLVRMIVRPDPWVMRRPRA
jgi:four helix bundle protein